MPIKDRIRRGTDWLRIFVIGVLATIAIGVAGAFYVCKIGSVYMGADIKPAYIERSWANMMRDASIARHAPKVNNPVPISPTTLQQGSTVYHQDCELCHGDQQHHGALENAAYPKAPPLLQKPPDDPDAQLYWVVDHGIRFTGMPAWGKVLQPDQIWSVINFVKHSGQIAPQGSAPSTPQQ